MSAFGATQTSTFHNNGFANESGQPTRKRLTNSVGVRSSLSPPTFRCTRKQPSNRCFSIEHSGQQLKVVLSDLITQLPEGVSERRRQPLFLHRI